MIETIQTIRLNKSEIVNAILGNMFPVMKQKVVITNDGNAFIRPMNHGDWNKDWDFWFNPDLLVSENCNFNSLDEIEVCNTDDIAWAKGELKDNLLSECWKSWLSPTDEKILIKIEWVD